MRFSKTNYLKLSVIGIAVFALAGFAWTGGRLGSPRVDNTFVGTLGGSDRDAVSVAAFNEAAKVFFSARCANCHPAGDVPTQGDEMSPHTMAVTRGKDGGGVYGQRCTTCHQNENLDGEHMPPGTSKPWHMPPASHKMPFQGLTAGQLCRNFKDPKQNGGFKTAKEAMEHVHKRDPLVTWAWDPGNGRTKPPLSLEQFEAKVREWVDNGAACPEN
jgi:cytochrome c5